MSDLVDLSVAREAKAKVTRQGDMVWVCRCGCTTHYHRADGVVECSACGIEPAELTGDWRLRVPATPDDPERLDAGNFKTIDLCDAQAFFRRQLKRDDLIRAVVVVIDDGGMSTWFDEIDTPERNAWLRRKLSEAADRAAGQHSALTGPAPDIPIPA